MCIKSDFKEILFKLAANGQIDRAFLLTLKFCPQGDVCPCPEYKIIKKCVLNQTSKRLILNLQQMGKVIRPLC